MWKRGSDEVEVLSSKEDNLKSELLSCIYFLHHPAIRLNENNLSEQTNPICFENSKEDGKMQIEVPVRTPLRPNPHWTRAQIYRQFLWCCLGPVWNPIGNNRFNLLAFAPRIQCGLGLNRPRNQLWWTPNVQLHPDLTKPHQTFRPNNMTSLHIHLLYFLLHSPNPRQRFL